MSNIPPVKQFEDEETMADIVARVEKGKVVVDVNDGGGGAGSAGAGGGGGSPSDAAAAKPLLVKGSPLLGGKGPNWKKTGGKNPVTRAWNGLTFGWLKPTLKSAEKRFEDGVKEEAIQLPEYDELPHWEEDAKEVNMLCEKVIQKVVEKEQKAADNNSPKPRHAVLSAVLGPLIPQLILFLLLDLLWFHVMMAPASTLLWWQTDATTHLEDGFDAANADPDAPNKLPQDYTNLLSRTLAFTMLMLGARVLEKFLKAHSIMLKKIIGIKIQTGIMSCLLFKQLEKSSPVGPATASAMATKKKTDKPADDEELSANNIMPFLEYFVEESFMAFVEKGIFIAWKVFFAVWMLQVGWEVDLPADPEERASQQALFWDLLPWMMLPSVVYIAQNGLLSGTLGPWMSLKFRGKMDAQVNVSTEAATNAIPLSMLTVSGDVKKSRKTKKTTAAASKESDKVSSWRHVYLLTRILPARATEVGWKIWYLALIAYQDMWATNVVLPLTNLVVIVYLHSSGGMDGYQFLSKVLILYNAVSKLSAQVGELDLCWYYLTRTYVDYKRVNQYWHSLEDKSKSDDSTGAGGRAGAAAPAGKGGARLAPLPLQSLDDDTILQIPATKKFSFGSTSTKQLAFDNLTLKQGDVCVLEAAPSTGKTMTLLALLNELHASSGGGSASAGASSSTQQHVNPNLIRCYVAERPVLLTRSIKYNITFGLPYDKVLFRTALYLSDFAEVLHDLEMSSIFVEQEETLLVSNGSNLSGGQRFRVSIARAVYCILYRFHYGGVPGASALPGQPEQFLLLLDNSFSALDKSCACNVILRVFTYFKEKHIPVAAVVTQSTDSAADHETKISGNKISAALKLVATRKLALTEQTGSSANNEVLVTEVPLDPEDSEEVDVLGGPSGSSGADADMVEKLKKEEKSVVEAMNAYLHLIPDIEDQLAAASPKGASSPTGTASSPRFGSSPSSPASSLGSVGGGSTSGEEEEEERIPGLAEREVAEYCLHHKPGTSFNAPYRTMFREAGWLLLTLYTLFYLATMFLTYYQPIVFDFYQDKGEPSSINDREMNSLYWALGLPLDYSYSQSIVGWWMPATFLMLFLLFVYYVVLNALISYRLLKKIGNKFLCALFADANYHSEEGKKTNKSNAKKTSAHKFSVQKFWQKTSTGAVINRVAGDLSTELDLALCAGGDTRGPALIIRTLTTFPLLLLVFSLQNFHGPKHGSTKNTLESLSMLTGCVLLVALVGWFLYACVLRSFRYLNRELQVLLRASMTETCQLFADADTCALTVRAFYGNQAFSHFGKQNCMPALEKMQNTRLAAGTLDAWLFLRLQLTLVFCASVFQIIWVVGAVWLLVAIGAQGGASHYVVTAGMFAFGSGSFGWLAGAGGDTMNTLITEFLAQMEKLLDINMGFPRLEKDLVRMQRLLDWSDALDGGGDGAGAGGKKGKNGLKNGNTSSKDDEDFPEEQKALLAPGADIELAAVPKLAPTEAIRVDNISVSYGTTETDGDDDNKVLALDNVSLSVKKGAKVLVSGRSGSGKSTFMSCLLGMVTPNSGKVVRDGAWKSNEKLNTEENEAALFSQFVVFPQSPLVLKGSFFYNMDIHNAPVHGIPSSSLHVDLMLAALKDLGFETLAKARIEQDLVAAEKSTSNISAPGKMKKLLAEYYGGLKGPSDVLACLSPSQRQLLHCARVIYKENLENLLSAPDDNTPKKIWLLDEISASLPDQAADECVREVLAQAGPDTTLIAITHQEHLPVFDQFTVTVQMADGKIKKVLKK